MKDIISDLFEDCKFNLTIYCEVPSKPSGWSKFWNSSNHKVIWGYKKES